LFGEDEDEAGFTPLLYSIFLNSAQEIVLQKLHPSLSKRRAPLNADILNLLTMSDMWRSRAPPTPLDFDKILNDSFVLPNAALLPQVNGGSLEKSSRQAYVNGNESSSNGQPSVSNPSSELKDQRMLTLKENLELFVSRFVFNDTN
jgi:hypothetical protein